jgi:hypothetical protein
MPAGIILRNQLNELTFSSDAVTYCYVGQATNTAIQQPFIGGSGWQAGVT